MAHLLSDYLALLHDLAADGFALRPIRDHFAESAGAPLVASQLPATAARVYLRHDVDRLPERAVAMAQAEAACGVAATYYFRCDAGGRFPADAMRRIAGRGHEVGFHYECLSRCGGNVAAARRRFATELAACRSIAPVVTVAPHGAPLSSVSNMDLAGGGQSAACAACPPDAQGLLGDAHAIDFTLMLYITDTGGTFGSRHNLRDRPAGRMLTEPVHPLRLAAWLNTNCESRVVLSCHPERWPAGRAALLQAEARDRATNVAKLVLRRFR